MTEYERNTLHPGGRDAPVAVVVVPTLNEAGNVERLVPSLLALENTRVVVVDDASADGTAEHVAALAAADPRVRLLRREARLGYASACLQGFQEALGWGADYVVQMDADLSHDPVALPQFLRLADTCDVVQGSRYIPGGSVADWGALRRFLSRAGNLYARLFLGLPVRDCTGGYRLYRASVLRSIRLDSIRSNGYAFLTELLYHCHAAGWNIRETPIVFRERTLGRSKMSLRIILEAVWRVPMTRFTVDRSAFYPKAAGRAGSPDM